MYGLPDSMIVGTAKRFTGKLKKVREYERTEHWLEWLLRKLDDWIPDPAPEGLKEAREAFYQEHGVYPPFDPRELQ